MTAFKGRLSFQQYMLVKLTKYGINVWIVADAANRVKKPKAVTMYNVPINSARNTALAGPAADGINISFGLSLKPSLAMH